MTRGEAIEFAKEQQEIFGGRMGEFLKFVEDELTQINASNTLNALDCVDSISRAAAIDVVLSGKVDDDSSLVENASECNSFLDWAAGKIMFLPPAPRWIPVKERLPENTDPVNITWVNRKPELYYADIKDKPFTATGHYCNGRWWWYSSVCQDYLDEYGECEMDEMDGDIEVLAWMPLPEPWKGD